MRARKARFATVLFTDIVGSTAIAAELGDRSWKLIVARHDRLVRECVRRFGGREQDSAGDGFFVGFDDQAAAIRCACAVADGVQDLGLQVRCGLNVGTAENLGGKIGGLMVVTAARIMAVAEPNEVLVSRVLRDLVPGAGLTFGEPRPVSLKGIEGVVEVSPVTGVDGRAREAPPSIDEAAQLRRSFEPPPFRKRRSVRLAVLGAAAIAILGVVTLAILRRPEPAVEVRAQSLLQVDPSTGDLLDDILVEGVLSPPAAVPAHEIWLCASENEVISILDADAGTLSTLGAVKEPHGLAYLDGSVWVATGTQRLVRLSAATHLLTSKAIQLGGGIGLMAAGEGLVWTSAHDAQRVIGVDPSTSHVAVRGRIGTGSNGIGIGYGSVWVANYSSGTVSRIDPDTGVSREIEVGVERDSGGAGYLAPGGPSSFAFGFGSVWITDPQFGVVYRMDPDTEMITDTIRVGAQSSNYVSGVAIANDAVWISSPTSKTLVRIDPGTNDIDLRIQPPHTPQDVLEAFGSLWVVIAV